MRVFLRMAAVAGIAAICAVFVLGYGGKQGRSVVSSVRSLATRGQESVTGGPAVGSRESVKRCLTKHGVRVSSGSITLTGVTIQNGLVALVSDDEIAQIDVEQSVGAAREAAGEIDRADLAGIRAKSDPAGRAEAEALEHERLDLNQRVIRNVVVEWFAGPGPKPRSERLVATCVKTGK